MSLVPILAAVISFALVFIFSKNLMFAAVVALVALALSAGIMTADFDFSRTNEVFP